LARKLAKKKIAQKKAEKEGKKLPEEKKPKLAKRAHPRGRGRKNLKKKAFVRLLHQ